MSESIPTREADFDKELGYSLFDEFMARVDLGELTFENAIINYKALVELADARDDVGG